MADSSVRVGVWPVALVWVLTAAGYAARSIANAATTPLLLDTDDAMRLTEVRDFLHGQNWFDIVQHRLNTPYGAEMHWSRLIDLPEATILFLLRPFLGPLAETVTAYVWPLLLLAPLLWLTARIAVRLGGRLALWPALLLTPFGIIALTEFVPGRLDHHSAQLLCTLVMMYCAIAALDRPRFALGAGIAAGVALAIGIEGLPLVGMTVTIFALMWVAGDKREALRDFGLSFGLSMALALAQGVPPWRWFELRLDAISIVYAGAAVLCAIAFLTLSLLPLRSWIARLAAAVVAAIAVVAILLALDPAILKGPYAALDPWLVQNWLSHIAEAESWLQSMRGDPVYPLAVTIPVLIGLATAIWNAVRLRADRGAWLVAIAFLVMGLAVMLIQIRAARLVTPLAIPACATLIAALWQHFRDTRRVLPAIGIFVTSLASAGIVIAAIVTFAEPDDPANATLGNAPPANGAAVSRDPCLLPAAFTDLAGLPPERIMAPIDLGSHILAYTPHAVVGAPYHRNQQGLLDTFHFFNEPIAEARTILDARGISLVVICPSMREIRGLVDHAPDSFISLFAANQLPAWLVDRSLPGAALKLYSVSPR